MDFTWQEIWRLIKRWWWLAAIGVILSGGTGYYFSSKKPNIYQARTRLMVGSSISSPDPRAQDFGLSLTLAEAYAEMVRQRPITQAVAKRLDLPMEWWQLVPSIQTSVIQSAQILEIRFVHTSPDFAALAANALAEELIQQSPANSQNRIDRAFVEQELADAQSKIEEADLQIQELRDRMLQLSSAAELEEARQRLAELEQVKTNYRSAYTELAGLLNTESPNTLTVLEPASAPSVPIAPNPKKEGAMAAMAGLALAIGAVVLIEFADDTLRVDDPASNAVMGVPLLGTLPRIPGGHCAPRSPEAEIIRQLRTKVLLSVPSGRLKSMIITSAQPKDGKTVTTANLGIAMAGGGARVVLIDADMRAPALHEWFDQPNLAGLADLLQADQVHCEELLPELLRDTAVPGLKLLSAGHLPLDPSILLASPNMGNLLELLSGQFDIVIFDSPPILAAPDASILAMLVQATLLVVSPAQTSRRAARRSRDALQSRAEIQLIGIALNRTSLGSYAYPYYYHQKKAHQPGYQTRLLQKLPRPVSSLVGVGKPQDPNLISSSEAAEILGVRRDTIKRWCEEGRLPAQKIGLKWWVFRDQLQGTPLDRLVTVPKEDSDHASNGRLKTDELQQFSENSDQDISDLEPVDDLLDNVKKAFKEEGK